MISTYEVHCGIAEYTHFLGSALQRRGHEVKIFAETVYENNYEPFENPLPYTRCWERGTSIDKLITGVQYETSYSTKLSEVEDWKPEIVHLQYESGFAGPLVKASPNVITFHSIDKQCAKYPYGIVHSEWQRKAFPKDAKMTIIPHGSFSVKKYPKNEVRTELQIPEDAFVITTFGFLGVAKAFHYLVTALPRLDISLGKVMLISIGGVHPVMKERMLDFARPLERLSKTFPNKIRLVETRENDLIDKYLCASDLLTLFRLGGEKQILSVSGAAHRVIGSGVPLILLQHPIFSDLTNGVNCVKISRDTDILELDTTFREIVSRTKLLKTISEGQVKYAQETSWDNVAKLHEEWYEKVVNSENISSGK